MSWPAARRRVPSEGNVQCAVVDLALHVEQASVRDGTRRYDRPDMPRLFSLRRHGLPRRWLFVVAGCMVAALTWTTQVYVWVTDPPVPVPAGLSSVRTGPYLTRFEAWGAPTAHPVVLVHGAFESVVTWGPVARLLAPHHHVEAYDLSGYGYTQRVGPYTTESLANQLAAFQKGVVDVMFVSPPTGKCGWRVT